MSLSMKSQLTAKLKRKKNLFEPKLGYNPGEMFSKALSTVPPVRR